MILGWVPFKIVSDIPALHSRWLLSQAKKNVDLKNGFLRIFFWRFIDVKQTIVIIGSAHLYILS
jgi:hypothetical protein